MKTKLMKLYNTLVTIETKGESTKIMADCLRYIEAMVVDLNKPTESNITDSE